MADIKEKKDDEKKKPYIALLKANESDIALIDAWESYGRMLRRKLKMRYG
jgi:hypothetical protein